MDKKITLLSILSLVFFMNISELKASSTPSADDVDIHEQEDPFEGFNRAMFSFNYKLDKYILKPVAKGYRAVTTQDIRDRVSSALSNIREPISVVNYLLQLEPKKSLISLGRFVVNSTLGLAGMFDVATGWGWTVEKTNFDSTLATWCVPEGPYLVLPFLNSTTPRTAVARLVDTFAEPVYWATESHEDGNLAYLGYLSIQTVALREANLDLVDSFERDSVDLYTTMRSFYMQNKKAAKCINDPNPSNSYDFDFGYEEEDELN